MPETYGVMVYQEDVIQWPPVRRARPREADVLRRDVGQIPVARRVQKARRSFFDKAADKGHAPTVAEVWRQVESFAGYAFAKGHSASFAVESYQSLFLEAYWPLEYMTACINNFGGFYRTEFYVHEARLLGGRIAAPCVNTGGYLAGYDHGPSPSASTSSRVWRAKPPSASSGARHAGPYRDLEDLVRRTGIGLEQLLTVIRIGPAVDRALKQQLQWEAHFLLGLPKQAPAADLFREAEPPNTGPASTLPTLEGGSGEDAYDEIELLGFPLSSPPACSPPRRSERRRRHARPCPAGTHRPRGHHRRLPRHRQGNRHRQGDRMLFGCFVDREGNGSTPSTSRRRAYLRGWRLPNAGTIQKTSDALMWK